MDSYKEHTEAVKRILQSQNYYEMLGVTVVATTQEITAAYKKLAFLLHPDKNTDEDATKAFQIMGNAKDVLMDESQRAQYDKTNCIYKCCCFANATPENQEYDEEYKESQQAKEAREELMRRRAEEEEMMMMFFNSPAEILKRKKVEEIKNRILSNMFVYL